MAEFYLDISAIGSEYQAYADIPATWAVPQDGNGKAGPGHSAAVAIATIDCASASASGAGQLSLLGQTVSSTLTGSGATLATNIAAAINAYATAVIATYSAALLPLNKLVYARVNPGLTTQVQVMMRIAGVDWNGMTPASAGTWGTAPTMGAFAGGADGPFAIVHNDTGIFGKAVAGYGIWFNNPPGVNVPTGSDVVHCRTKRDGGNLAVAYSFVAAYSVTWQGRSYLYDDGNLWTGDNGTMQATLTNAHTSAVTLAHAYGYVMHESRAKYGFELVFRTTGNSGGVIQGFTPNGNGAVALFKRCKWTEGSGSIGSIDIWSEIANRVGTGLRFLDGKITITGGRQVIKSSGATAQQRNIVLDGTAVEFYGAVGTIGPFLNFVSTTNTCGQIRWVGGSAYDVNGVYSCPSPFYVGTGATVAAEVVIKDVAGITDPSLALVVGAYNSRLMWDAKDAFRVETNNYVIDWKATGFPYLNSQNLYGDYWSHRVTWKNSVFNGPLVFEAQYRDAAAIKTVALEMYTQDATALYLDEFSLVISYTDSSNVARTEETSESYLDYLLSGRDELTSSAATWNANGVANCSAKKLSVTTQYPIKMNSRVTGRLSINSAHTPSLTFYVSPELVFA